MALVLHGFVGAHQVLQWRFKAGTLSPIRQVSGFNVSPRSTGVVSVKSRRQLHCLPRAALPPLEVLAVGSVMMSSSEGTGEDVNANYAKGSVGIVEAMTGKTVEESPNVVIDRGIGGDGDLGSGGGGGGGDGNGGDGRSEPVPPEQSQKALSLSQKLTLGYAALVGVGGLIGFLKSGSVKSLFSGGLTAVALLAVNVNLPANPVGASSLGAGISALLLFVMGSRFIQSGKIFPAGVVSLVSLIMTGGYLHGILKTSH